MIFSLRNQQWSKQALLQALKNGFVEGVKEVYQQAGNVFNLNRFITILIVGWMVSSGLIIMLALIDQFGYNYDTVAYVGMWGFAGALIGAGMILFPNKPSAQWNLAIMLVVLSAMAAAYISAAVKTGTPVEMNHMLKTLLQFRVWVPTISLMVGIEVTFSIMAYVINLIMDVFPEGLNDRKRIPYKVLFEKHPPLPQEKHNRLIIVTIGVSCAFVMITIASVMVVSVFSGQIDLATRLIVPILLGLPVMVFVVFKDEQWINRYLARNGLIRDDLYVKDSNAEKLGND